MNIKYFIYLLFLHISYVYSENEINKDLKVFICTIAKMENDYINDWCRYHFNLGFDEIYIYDNNDEDYEPIENRIDKDIISKVHIIKSPGILNNFQTTSYNSFINENYLNYDWAAFIDVDEFIVLKKWKTIKQFLSEKHFQEADTIKFQWHMYGDDNEIKQDISIPIYNRIKHEVFSEYRKNDSKCVVRGKKKFLFIHCHYPVNMDKSYCNEFDVDGNPYVQDESLKRFKVSKRYEDAYIAHYMTKTLDEFINQKFKRIEHNFNRGGLMANNDPYKRFIYYFNINEITSEKLAYIKEKLNVDFIVKEGNEYKMYKPGITYWNDEPNASDYFGVYIVDKLKINKRSSLAIMGNILSWKPIESTRYIWGCGGSKNRDPIITDVTRYSAVAGKKTLETLSKFGNISNVIITDPGLLASFLYKPKVEKKYKLCVISHWQDYDLLKDYASSEVNVIHMKTNDIELILDKINECQFTVSTSLHGIVFSHSYGIKSIKLDLKESKNYNLYKFEDYYSVINSEFKQISSEKLNEIIESDEKLEELKESISVPSSLEILRNQLEFLSVSPVQNLFSGMKNVICTFIESEDEFDEETVKRWITHYLDAGYSDIFIFNTKETFKNFEDLIVQPKKEKVHLFNVLTENSIKDDVMTYLFINMSRYFESVSFIDINNM